MLDFHRNLFDGYMAAMEDLGYKRSEWEPAIYRRANEIARAISARDMMGLSAADLSGYHGWKPRTGPSR